MSYLSNSFFLAGLMCQQLPGRMRGCQAAGACLWGIAIVDRDNPAIEKNIELLNSRNNLALTLK